MAVTNEERLLKKLEKLHTRRLYHELRLGFLEPEITQATRELADLRGVAFIRPEAARLEVEARMMERRKVSGE